MRLHSLIALILAAFIMGMLSGAAQAQTVKELRSISSKKVGTLRWTPKMIRFLCNQRHPDDLTMYETCAIYFGGFRGKLLTEEQEIEVHLLHKNALAKLKAEKEVKMDESTTGPVKMPKERLKPPMSKPPALKAVKKRPAMSSRPVLEPSLSADLPHDSPFEEDMISSMKYGKVVVHKKDASPILPDYYGLEQVPATHK